MTNEPRCSHCDALALSDPCADCLAAGHRDVQRCGVCVAGLNETVERLDKVEIE